MKIADQIDAAIAGVNSEIPAELEELHRCLYAVASMDEYPMLAKMITEGRVEMSMSRPKVVRDMIEQAFALGMAANAADSLAVVPEYIKAIAEKVKENANVHA